MLSWFEFGLASALFTAAFWLICRNLLKLEADHAVFALLIQWVPLVFLFPFLLIDPIHLPGPADALSGWFWLLAAGLAWALQQVLVFKSLRFISASVREPVYQTKLLWAALFAVLLTHEIFVPASLLGIAFVLLGALVMAYRSPVIESNPDGLILVLFSALLTGLAYVFDKLALAFFSVTAYAILVSAISGACIAVYLGYNGSLVRVVAFALKYKKMLLLASVSGALSYWLLVKAISVGPVGAVAAVLEISMVLTTLGGILLLGEKKSVGRKLVGIALALLGVLFLRGYLAFAIV